MATTAQAPSDLVRELMLASADALQENAATTVWTGFSAAAELLDHHEKGIINLDALPLAKAWIEAITGQKIP